MERSLRSARVLGLSIEIDRSWALGGLLVVLNLGAVFRAAHPEWPAGVAVVTALAGAVLLLGSTVAHELAHALAASILGLRVHHIRLSLLGGISNLERAPCSPRTELLLGFAGPLTGVGMGLLLVLVASAMLPASDGDDVFAALSPPGLLLLWLGPANVLVALFNLLPALPLDGGRVLRALLWWLTGDVATATRGASIAGLAIGVVLVAAGIAVAVGVDVPPFGRGLGAGLWLAFLGAHLASGARRSLVT